MWSSIHQVAELGFPLGDRPPCVAPGYFNGDFDPIRLTHPSRRKSQRVMNKIDFDPPSSREVLDSIFTAFDGQHAFGRCPRVTSRQQTTGKEIPVADCGSPQRGRRNASPALQRREQRLIFRQALNGGDASWVADLHDFTRDNRKRSVVSNPCQRRSALPWPPSREVPCHLSAIAASVRHVGLLSPQRGIAVQLG